MDLPRKKKKKGVYQDFVHFQPQELLVLLSQTLTFE
jgi:hypothetical protein